MAGGRKEGRREGQCLPSKYREPKKARENGHSGDGTTERTRGPPAARPTTKRKPSDGKPPT